MKIAIKYGLLITAVVIAWVVIARFVLNLDQNSKANLIAPILFNLTTILAIYLGMKARKDELNGNMTLKQGIKIGMAISLAYAVSACLFFFIQFLIAGPKLMLSDAGEITRPMWQIALMAYSGLFFGSLIFGLIYSTVISFFLARRQGRDSAELI